VQIKQRAALCDIDKKGSITKVLANRKVYRKPLRLKHCMLGQSCFQPSLYAACHVPPWRHFARPTCSSRLPAVTLNNAHNAASPVAQAAMAAFPTGDRYANGIIWYYMAGSRSLRMAARRAAAPARWSAEGRPPCQRGRVDGLP